MLLHVLKKFNLAYSINFGSFKKRGSCTINHKNITDNTVSLTTIKMHTKKEAMKKSIYGYVTYVNIKIALQAK